MQTTFKNTRAFYKLKGNPAGEAVVLVHGFTETPRMWKVLEDDLKKEFRLLIPRLLGHGKTGLTGPVLTMEEQALMIARLMDWHGIRKAHFVGHSMGGYISLAFAELYPERVLGLTLLNSHPFADPPDKRQARREGARAVKENAYAYLSALIPSFFAPYNREKLQKEIRKLICEAVQMPPEGIAGALLGMMVRPDRSDLFGQAGPYPKAWIISKDDPLIDADAFERKAREMQGVELKVLDGGHMSWLENPDGMRRAVSDFLFRAAKRGRNE
ncbi:MAG: alpha/beta fold hydrolase [Chlorobi bacterium]|nr:alpha/beta fold hydrolase [Chlorobiota bacterium]